MSSFPKLSYEKTSFNNDKQCSGVVCSRTKGVTPLSCLAMQLIIWRCCVAEHRNGHEIKPPIRGRALQRRPGVSIPLGTIGRQRKRIECSDLNDSEHVSGARLRNQFVLINGYRCVLKKHYGKATAYTVYVNFRYEYGNSLVHEKCVLRTTTYWHSHVELPI